MSSHESKGGLDRKEMFFFFQAKDGIRDAQESRGLGDVYKRQDNQTKKAKTDYINSLEKKKKKVQNSLESSENRINKANSEIDKVNAEIPRNDKMQEQVNEKIAKQQTVYQKFADKIITIKSY